MLAVRCPSSMTTDYGNKLWWALAIALLVALAAVVLAAPRGRPRVVFQTDPQGNASILGIPLRNRYVRDGMFKTLHSLGCEIKLSTVVAITNSTQVSNLADTLTAIGRLSPPRTNSNAASPYE